MKNTWNITWNTLKKKTCKNLARILEFSTWKKWEPCLIEFLDGTPGRKKGQVICSLDVMFTWKLTFKCCVKLYLNCYFQNKLQPKSYPNTQDRGINTKHPDFVLISAETSNKVTVLPWTCAIEQCEC